MLNLTSSSSCWRNKLRRRKSRSRKPIADEDHAVGAMTDDELHMDDEAPDAEAERLLHNGNDDRMETVDPRADKIPPDPIRIPQSEIGETT